MHFYLSSVSGLLDLLRTNADPSPDISAGGAFIEILPKETETALTALALLTARDPSISVKGANLAGVRNGSDVRVRGVRSANGSNTPSVYVDGAPTGLERLADISAIDVWRIRVFRGPSAASMYPDAANGVILVETWKGRRKGGT